MPMMSVHSGRVHGGIMNLSPTLVCAWYKSVISRGGPDNDWVLCFPRTCLRLMDIFFIEGGGGYWQREWVQGMAWCSVVLQRRLSITCLSAFLRSEGLH